MKNLINKEKISFLPYLLVMFILFSFNLVNAYGQDEIQVSEKYQIELKDGTIITGTIISVSAETIKVETGSMGTVDITRANIAKLTLLVGQDSDKGWFPNPNPSKYLLGNSAIPLEKGSGYYQNVWIFVSAFNYAFTDYFSVTAGFEILSLMVADLDAYGYYVNPKVSFKVADNLYIGGNLLYANTIKTTEDFGGLGTLNGFATYGNSNNNITAGLGWGFVDGDFSSKPVITISGMVRASKRLAFVSENWILPIDGASGLISYGVRFLGQNTSIDLAFINSLEEISGIGIPILDFVVNF